MHKSGYFKNGSKLNATMLQSTWNYNAFGSTINTRAFSSGAYRYGFNGKELDKNEEGMGGGGSTYDYGFRIYNPNLGKFLSVDPLFKSYPWYTPYQFAGNKVIIAIDLDGLEEACVNDNTCATEPNTTTTTTNSNIDVCENAVDNCSSQDVCNSSEPTVLSSRTHTNISTTHSFEWCKGKINYIIGVDKVKTHITQETHVTYSDGSYKIIRTYITYETTIDENGKSSDISMTYWQSGLENSVSGTVNLISTPLDFRSLYNAANNYKNDPKTKPGSIMQTITWNNEHIPEIGGLNRQVVDGALEALSFFGKPDEIEATICGTALAFHDLFTEETKSTNAALIKIRIMQSEWDLNIY